MEFGQRVSLLWSVLVNQPGEELEDMWGRKAEDLHDIYETTLFLEHAASVAYARSQAFLRADVPEEDNYWNGGPTDPEASKALRVLHACLIRQIFTWPGIPMPDTEWSQLEKRDAGALFPDRQSFQ